MLHMHYDRKNDKYIYIYINIYTFMDRRACTWKKQNKKISGSIFLINGWIHTMNAFFFLSFLFFSFLFCFWIF